MADWRWDDKLQRYRDVDSGRIISFQAANDLVNQAVDVSGNIVAQLANLLSTNRISVSDWVVRFKQEIKDAYIQQAILAAGGRSQMTQELWGIVGGTIREQYNFLIGFANEISNGKLTQGQIASRSQMYINSSREAYWRIKDRWAKKQGYTEERWLTKGDDHVCGPCTTAGSIGWQPIGTFAQPGSGLVQIDPETSCAGLTSCRCEKEYR